MANRTSDHARRRRSRVRWRGESCQRRASRTAARSRRSRRSRRSVGSRLTHDPLIERRLTRGRPGPVDELEGSDRRCFGGSLSTADRPGDHRRVESDLRLKRRISVDPSDPLRRRARGATAERGERPPVETADLCRPSTGPLPSPSLGSDHRLIRRISSTLAGPVTAAAMGELLPRRFRGSPSDLRRRGHHRRVGVTAGCFGGSPSRLACGQRGRGGWSAGLGRTSMRAARLPGSECRPAFRCGPRGRMRSLICSDLGGLRDPPKFLLAPPGRNEYSFLHAR